MRELVEACEFCVFDLETTGLDPHAGAEPIEAGAVRVVGGQVTGTYESFASPRGDIPGEVQGLTGISPEDVKDAPSPPAVLGELMEFAGDAVLVAHNIDFDRSFLDVYAPSPVINDELDTLRMARALIGGTDHSLDHLVQRFGLTRSDAHRALEDARATAELFLKLADRAGSYEEYVQCGIPRSVLREDLERVLIAAGVSGEDRSAVAGSFGTTRSLLEADPEEVVRRTGRDGSDVRRILREVRDVYEDEKRELEPPVRLTNCYRMRFWGPSNYALNGFGLLLLLSGLVASTPGSFYARVLASVPFFVTSPIMTYLRERSYGGLIRFFAGLVVLALWTVVLVVYGQLEAMREELVSLMTSGGLF